MKRKKHTPEQIIRKLREAEALLSEGKGLAEVCQRLAVSEATFHRWRNQYGGTSSQDAVSLKAQSWAGNELSLALEGASGTNETYWIHVPQGFHVSTIFGDGLSAPGGSARADVAGGHALAIEVSFPAGAAERTQGTLTVLFER